MGGDVVACVVAPRRGAVYAGTGGGDVGAGEGGGGGGSGTAGGPPLRRRARAALEHRYCAPGGRDRVRRSGGRRRQELQGVGAVAGAVRLPERRRGAAGGQADGAGAA